MNLREAAQMALEALQESKPIDINDPTAFYRSAHAIEALRTLLAQPEPEPVAWATDIEFDEDTEVIPANEKGRLGTGLIDIPLYTAPPQREWQGLMDKEILADDVLRYHFGLSGGVGPVSKKGKAIVAAVEAKLKEKEKNS